MVEDLLRAYRDHLTAEPPAPHENMPIALQETVAAEYRAWDRLARSYRTVLAPRLLERALAELDSGPTFVVQHQACPGCEEKA